ncbi:MAG: thioredoxin domain-containing protein, partial [Terriglobia bacterium]
ELSQREQFHDGRTELHVSCEQVIRGQEPGSKQKGSVPVRTILGNDVGGEDMLRKVCLRWSRIFLLGAVFTMVMSALPAQAEMPAQPLVAEINGEAITVEHLEKALGARLSQIEEQIYALKRDKLNSLIAERLLRQEADKRGISVETLLDTEVIKKAPSLIEVEIEAVYQENRSRLPEDEAVGREKVRAALRQQKWAVQRKMFLDMLRSQATLVDRLPPPPITRVEVSSDGAPVRGKTDAAVTLVEFSDFHCPFCKRVQSTLNQVLAKYPEQVQLYYRHLPLDSLHPQARRAAEAARCAQDQGKFWEYHDVLFAQAPNAAEVDLKNYAAQVGLDSKEFTSCLFQSIHHAAVQRDLDEGSRLGVEGTPAFFINGRFLSGAQPLEEFVRVIDEELARVDKRAQVSVRTQ